MSAVFAINPKLHPLFIKPLYEMMDKFKNNWLIIKAIKLIDRIIKLEPRLVKKLVEPYQKLLRSTSAKSIEFELLNTIIKHFKDQPQVYNQACENLKSFINHTDANLRSLGLSCLKSMLANNKSIISDYKDYLLESLKKADFPTKRQILEIFHTFVQKDLLEEVVSELLGYLEQSAVRDLDEALKEALIEAILKLCKKDNFVHIEDFEWLLFEVFGKLMRRVSSVPLSRELASCLLTLILRVEDLKTCVQKFCVNTMMGFDEIATENQTFTDVKISIQDRSKKAEISAKEVIFQTLVFLAGEYASNYRIPGEFFGLLEFLNNEKLLYLYQNSFGIIKDASFKLAVCLCVVLRDGAVEKLRGSLEKKEVRPGVVEQVIERMTQESPKKDLVLTAMIRALCYLISIGRILARLSLVSSYNAGSSNLEFGLLFNTIGLDYKSLISEPEIIDEQAFLDKINVENLKKVAELRGLFQRELRPVHPDAQKFVKVPEGLDLEQGLEIDGSELEMIGLMKKEFEIEEAKESKSKGKRSKEKPLAEKEEAVDGSSAPDSNDIPETLDQGKDSEEKDEGGKQNEKTEEKPKKEYKLNVEDYLPPGVDANMLKGEEGKDSQPVKKAKKKAKNKE